MQGHSSEQGHLPDLPYHGLDWEMFPLFNLYPMFLKWWNPF